MHVLRHFGSNETVIPIQILFQFLFLFVHLQLLLRKILLPVFFSGIEIEGLWHCDLEVVVFVNCAELTAKDSFLLLLHLVKCCFFFFYLLKQLKKIDMNCGCVPTPPIITYGSSYYASLSSTRPLHHWNPHWREFHLFEILIIKIIIISI